MRVRFPCLVLLVCLICAAGCGRFAARRMVQAPNTYPKWLAPKAPVTLAFSDNILTAFTNQYLEVRSPRARIRYRVVEPANYEFRWTNHLDEAQRQLELSFTAKIDQLNKRTNQWTEHPRGTVVLLHGYGVSGFAMLPWALLLGQEGWRCVLVDLRGHGKSTGKQIFFGTQEVQDLRELLDRLEAEHGMDTPVSVVGHSYGAVLALRWKMIDSRVEKVVAMSPYADLSKAVLNVSEQYASWLPRSFLKAGLRKLRSCCMSNHAN
jgi:pimeloyl-ACP methyl ester carboxylesterase